MVTKALALKNIRRHPRAFSSRTSLFHDAPTDAASSPTCREHPLFCLSLNTHYRRTDQPIKTIRSLWRGDSRGIRPIGNEAKGARGVTTFSAQFPSWRSKTTTCGRQGKENSKINTQISHWGRFAEAVPPIALWQFSLTWEAQFCLSARSAEPWRHHLCCLGPTSSGAVARVSGRIGAHAQLSAGRASKSSQSACTPPQHTDSSFCVSFNSEVLKKLCGQLQEISRAPRLRSLHSQFLPQAKALQRQPPSTSANSPTPGSWGSQMLATIQATKRCNRKLGLISKSSMLHIYKHF